MWGIDGIVMKSLGAFSTKTQVHRYLLQRHISHDVERDFEGQSGSGNQRRGKQAAPKPQNLGNEGASDQVDGEMQPLTLRRPYHHLRVQLLRRENGE